MWAKSQCHSACSPLTPRLCSLATTRDSLKRGALTEVGIRPNVHSYCGYYFAFFLTPLFFLEVMLMRYETGHASVMASFALDGKVIVSCADFEAGITIVNVTTAEVIVTEDFDQLQEARNKSAYAISPTGDRVAAFVKEQTWGNNLCVYDVARQSYKSLRVCEGAALHVEFR